MSSSTTPFKMFTDEPEAPPIILGRSELELWATCPHAAFMLEKGQVSNESRLASEGDESHKVISACVKARRDKSANLYQLREIASDLAAKSRPDIQPGVIDACRSVYPILEHLCHKPYDTERAPEDILRYDGGEGAQSGQLAFDLLPAAEDGSRGPVRLTGELDLLLATPSKEEVEVPDWKSGYKHWTASDIEQSFQFQFYAALVFRTYQSVNRVRVRVFMPRKGTSTSYVEFRRDQMYVIESRLKSAVDICLKHRDAKDASEVPAWPLPEKCAICPAAPYCKLAHRPELDFKLDEAAYLAQYVAMQAAADRMADVMAVAVRQQGREIVGDGFAFGVDAPASSRSKPCKLYQIKTSNQED